MTWSKQYTSTNPVQAFGTDAGVSLLAAMDELISTWLPSRGWSTAAQTTQPNASDGDYRWWIDKDIQCIDNSSYAHRVIVHITGSSTKRFGYTAWDAGVPANTVFPTYDITGPSFGTEIEGDWEFWTSDQDSDSFLLVANGIDTGMIGFMPPTGSIFPGTPESNGYYPSTNAPLIPTGRGSAAWVTSQGNTYTDLSSSMNNAGNHFYAQPGQVKFNFASMSRGTSSTMGIAFCSTNSDCEMISDVRQGSNSFDGVNTTLIDGDYFIALGSGSKLLLNTGTVDPQY